jgi:hypothetical protein
MNPIADNMKVGTIGELLVQIRLLQCGVQAAPPIKDSGNDLIAIAGDQFRAVSVKTTTTGEYNKPDTQVYHVLAVVHLIGTDDQIELDRSRIFLIERDAVAAASRNCRHLEQYELSSTRVHDLFIRDV